MRSLFLVGVFCLFGCVGPAGPPGPVGPAGPTGQPGSVVTPDLAGVDLQGVDLMGSVQPQTITCSPGVSFCANSTRVATCTLSGADAILGADCGTVGTVTNPATCVTSGCPAGQAACCRRQNPVWSWNFTQPALAGAAYVADTSNGATYEQIGRACVGASLGISYAILNRPISACPSNAFYLQMSFDRSTVAVGATITLPPSPGTSLSANIGANSCAQWTGTMKIDSDLPDWSITINATCSNGMLTGTQVVGTMSGHE